MNATANLENIASAMLSVLIDNDTSKTLNNTPIVPIHGQKKYLHKKAFPFTGKAFCLY